MKELFNKHAQRAFKCAVAARLIPAQARFSPAVGFEGAMAVLWSSERDDATVTVWNIRADGRYIAITHDATGEVAARYARSTL